MTSFHGNVAQGAIKQDPATSECRVCLNNTKTAPHWLKSMYLCSEKCLRDNG